MKVIVQKFGGTSVDTPSRRNDVAKCIESAYNKGYGVVVVVSAMGRRGDPYATDSLLGLVAETRQFVPRRELDILMSCGEMISSVCVAAHLREIGLAVDVLLGGQAGLITDDEFTQANILRVDSKRIRTILSEGKIVVVAGFQGMTDNGDITTLGRGGSDTTAVALGASLQAHRVEIYTDVAGIMTADPKIEPKAQILREVTYQEVLQMAHKGAKVIHSRAVDMAMRHKLPLFVTALNVSEEGTSIVDAASPSSFIEKPIRPVTAVAHICNLAQFRFEPLDFQQTRVLYHKLAKARVSLDLINISPEKHIFVVAEEDLDITLKICHDLGFDPVVRSHVAKISAIGAAMHGLPGVFAGIVQSLTSRGISILQTSDSHMTISCLVSQEDVAAGVQALHKHFNFERM